MTERRFTPRQKPAEKPKPQQPSGPISEIFGLVSDIGKETKRIVGGIGWVFLAVAGAVGAGIYKSFKNEEPKI